MSDYRTQRFIDWLLPDDQTDEQHMATTHVLDLAGIDPERFFLLDELLAQHGGVEA